MVLVMRLIFSLAAVRSDLSALILQPPGFCLLYLYILVQFDYCAADWQCSVDLLLAVYKSDAGGP